MTSAALLVHTNFFHWRRLWTELGLAGDCSFWHSRLIAAYSEKHRSYHNLQHLDDCLRELDPVKKLVARPATIEVALWFHDSVYDPRSATNEEESATLAAVCLTSANASEELLEAVHRLILCTKTHRADDHANAALLIDIDLSILGQPPERFWSYERGIRAEYAWVPDRLYAEKRAEILSSFLRRDSLYSTGQFRSRYEAVARDNVAAAITKLNSQKSS